MKNVEIKQDTASQVNVHRDIVGSLVLGDSTHILSVKLQPEHPLTDYIQARQLADREAEQHLPEHMLMAWFDRDRNFESPQSAGECHEGCPTPGYVDYALNHGATLQVDIEHGRFVFFYTPVEW